MDRYIETLTEIKFVFFHNSVQPLPRLHRCKRPSRLSTQCACTVIPMVISCATNSSRVRVRERWQLSRILENKKTIFNEHPVLNLPGCLSSFVSTVSLKLITNRSLLQKLLSIFFLYFNQKDEQQFSFN